MKKQAKGSGNSSLTLLTITAGLLVIYWFFRWNELLIASMVISITGVFSGKFRYYADMVWMKFAWLLSLIIPNILLSLVFFFVVTPISLLAKSIRRKDPLALNEKRDSLFTTYPGEFTRESFENPW